MKKFFSMLEYVCSKYPIRSLTAVLFLFSLIIGLTATVTLSVQDNKVSITSEACDTRVRNITLEYDQVLSELEIKVKEKEKVTLQLNSDIEEYKRVIAEQSKLLEQQKQIVEKQQKQIQELLEGNTKDDFWKTVGG